MVRNICLAVFFIRTVEKGQSEELHDVTYENDKDAAGVTSLSMTNAESGSEMSETESIGDGNLRNMVTLLLYLFMNM